LARVQGTGKWGISSSGAPVTHTFVTPPQVGNGIIVPVIIWRGGSDFTSLVDNQGNSFTLVHNQLNGVNRTGIYYLPKLNAVTAPYTLTLTVSSVATSIMATAIEVGGVGAGLALDQKIGAGGSTSTPGTGTTPALTADKVIVVAAHTIDPSVASITVQSVSPAWTEEFEHLTNAWIVGEADSRILTGVAGTTQSCAWADVTAGAWSAALAVFKGT
jgi:hypothetical protein